MEVPQDFVVTYSILALVAKPLVHGMLVFAVNVDFVHHLEGYSVVFGAEFGDVFSCSRLLRSKAIAREAQDDEIIRAGVLVQFFQSFVLSRETTFGSGIYDKHSLSFQ